MIPCVELNEPVFGAPGELIGTMEEVEGEEMVVVEVKATLSLGWTNLSLGWINSNLPTTVATPSSTFGDSFSFLLPRKNINMQMVQRLRQYFV